MTRSSLTEETPAAPGWVESRVRELFAPLGPDTDGIRDAYVDCLAGVRGAVDVDYGHDRCRSTAIKALTSIVDDTAPLDKQLQALEAEIAGST